MADVDGEGADAAGFGFVNCSSPLSSTRTCALLSPARNCKKSQSEILAWDNCLYVIGAASTRPQARPAPAATLRTMAEAVMLRYATTFRPRCNRCALEYARKTVNDPVVSLSSSRAVTSPANSSSRAWPCTVMTETRSAVPMVMPVVLSSSWSGSR